MARLCFLLAVMGVCINMTTAGTTDTSAYLRKYVREHVTDIENLGDITTELKDEAKNKFVLRKGVLRGFNNPTLVSGVLRQDRTYDFSFRYNFKCYYNDMILAGAQETNLGSWRSESSEEKNKVLVKVTLNNKCVGTNPQVSVEQLDEIGECISRVCTTNSSPFMLMKSENWEVITKDVADKVKKEVEQKLINHIKEKLDNIPLKKVGIKGC